MLNSMSNHENLTRHSLPSLELLKQKWLIVPNAGKYVEWRGHSCIALRSVKWNKLFGKQVFSYL